MSQKPIIIGAPIIFSIPAEIKPILNAPEGAKIRLRFRINEIGFAFVKVGSEIAQHYLLSKEDKWELGGKVGVNART